MFKPFRELLKIYFIPFGGVYDFTAYPANEDNKLDGIVGLVCEVGSAKKKRESVQ